MRACPKPFLARHPALRDALCWSLPALAAGLALRCALLSYAPMAYWSKDSYSFMEFSFKLIEFGKWDMEEKRRWTYPILLLASHAGPGGCLRWVAWGQMAAGLGGVVTVAWIARRTLASWRWSAIPLSLFWAVHPAILYYEHCVLAESLFNLFFLAAAAGWFAWLNSWPEQRTPPIPSPGRFWWFFAPFALLILLKPSARFAWPGFVLAVLVSGLWRRLRPLHVAALLTLALLTPTVGRDSQGIRLVFTTLFPSIRLDSPAHAALKAEIAPLVRKARGNLDTYYVLDRELGIKDLLENPEEFPQYPAWSRLGGRSDAENTAREATYRALAFEALAHEPWTPFYVALQRAVASSGVEFDPGRLGATSQADQYEEEDEYARLAAERPALVRRLFGIPPDAPIPTLEAVQAIVSPAPESRAARWLTGYAAWHQRAFAVAAPSPGTPSGPPPITAYRLTWFGWLLIAGIATILATRHPTSPWGPWLIVPGMYLMGVFTTGSANPRFYLPVCIMAAFSAAHACEWIARWAARRNRTTGPG